MGETAAETRREIEHTRSELGGTIEELRSRGSVVRTRVLRVAAIAGGAALTGGMAVGVVVLVRRQRGGAITQAARRLPDRTRPAALPAARATERWLSRRSQRVQAQREQLIEALSQRIAENQALAERKANPLWRRSAAKALETAATVGVTALVRRLLEERNRNAELTGSAGGESRRHDGARAAEPVHAVASA